MPGRADHFVAGIEGGDSLETIALLKFRKKKQNEGVAGTGGMPLSPPLRGAARLRRTSPGTTRPYIVLSNEDEWERGAFISIC